MHADQSTRRNGHFAPSVQTAIVIPTYNELEKRRRMRCTMRSA